MAEVLGIATPWGPRAPGPSKSRIARARAKTHQFDVSLVAQEHAFRTKDLAEAATQAVEPEVGIRTRRPAVTISCSAADLLRRRVKLARAKTLDRCARDRCGAPTFQRRDMTALGIRATTSHARAPSATNPTSAPKTRHHGDRHRSLGRLVDVSVGVEPDRHTSGATCLDDARRYPAVLASGGYSSPPSAAFVPRSDGARAL